MTKQQLQSLHSKVTPNTPNLIAKDKEFYLQFKIRYFRFHIQMMNEEDPLESSSQPGMEKILPNANENNNFIFKAYAIVDVLDSAYSDTIHWSKSGTSFIIQNIEYFEVNILPKHFRHNRYQSFVRQLNMYDFHKIRNGDHYTQNKAEFKHDEFFRGCIDRLGEIKRKGFKEKNTKAHKINTKNSKRNMRKKNKKKIKPICKQKLTRRQSSLARVRNSGHSDVDHGCSSDKKEGHSENFHSSEENSFFHKINNQHLESLEKKENNLSGNTSEFKAFIAGLVEQVLPSNGRKSSQKFSGRIELAEWIKQRWDKRFPNNNDIQQMKEVYHQLKNRLISREERLRREGHLSHSEERQDLQLVDIGEEDNLISSIFKTEIKSTLIYINSETFINPANVNGRSFMKL